MTKSLKIYFSSYELSVMGMTLNCIQWWGCNSEFLKSVDDILIAITSRPTLAWNGSACYSPIVQIDLFENH